MKLPSLLLIASLAIPAAFAAKKTPQEYWNETGISTDIIIRLNVLTHQLCTHDLISLQGCVAAINSIGSHATPPLELVPSSLSKDPTFVGGMPFRIFPDFVLVARPKAEQEASALAAWKKVNIRREKLSNALKGVLAKDTSADFEAIFTNLTEFAIKDKNEDAMAAAGAITSMLNASIDPHAHLDAAAQVSDSLSDATEDFVGIGANLQDLNGHAIVQSPIDGGPAQKAGVMANDIIVAVDDVSVEGTALDDVVKKIRGIEGTIAKIKFMRKGSPVEISIQRGRIVIENVTPAMRSDLGEQYGYIKLRNFMDNNACARIEGMVKKFEAQKAKGIILDLRGNGGGLLDQANCIGGLFVGRKVIVKVKDLESDTFNDMTATKNQVTKLPLAVLIDSGSASASEILSGALQDYKRAWILGERSFGKASVQAPQAFKGNDKIMFYHTIQRFYQPSGRTNQIVGILPDLVVPVKPDATEEERFSLHEGDYFPNALAAVGEPWKEPRPDEVKKIEACVAEKNLARKEYEKAKANSEVIDYQLIAAQEVLSCGVN
ncbi:MAG: S41 family peptidase [Bdellovibrionota bacterium]